MSRNRRAQLRVGPVARAAAVLPAVLWTAALSGCGDGRSGERSPRAVREARPGGVAVVGGREPITTLNPLLSTDYVAHQVQKHVLLVTLVRLDEAMEPVPYLASRWALSEDSTRIVFHLRPDVSWHDGTPTTAADVAFTFRLARDTAVPFPNRSYFDGWKSVEVVDDTTVRFELEPRPDVLFGWSQTPLLPRHLLEGVDPARLGEHPWGTKTFVGNGPFRFVEKQGPDVWVFERNPDFPEALGGPPRLERWIYRVVPDETTLLAELRAGRVHFYLDLPPGQARRLASEPGIRVLTHAAPVVTFIAWNTRRPLFADRNVRRALTMAIDRRQLVEVAREGLGVVASGPVGPWHWAHDPAWRPLPYAPDSAAALLDAAGWRDTDGDGVRDRGGSEFSFQLMINENPVRRDVAVIVQNQLARVGVEARPRIQESASMGAAVTGSARAFDAAILSFAQDPVIDDRDQWMCERRDHPFHFSGFCDLSLDAILDSIPRTLDRDRRRSLYRRYHETVARAQPYTWLFFDVVAAGVREELRGVHPDARGDLMGVEGWWFDPEAEARVSPAP